MCEGINYTEEDWLDVMNTQGEKKPTATLTLKKNNKFLQSFIDQFVDLTGKPLLCIALIMYTKAPV